METVVKYLFIILSLIGVFLVALIFSVYPPCNKYEGCFKNKQPKKLPGEFYFDDLIPMEIDAEKMNKT